MTVGEMVGLARAGRLPWGLLLRLGSVRLQLGDTNAAVVGWSQPTEDESVAIARRSLLDAAVDALAGVETILGRQVKVKVGTAEPERTGWQERRQERRRKAA